MPSDNTFSGQITVSSRIVDYLSSGLYETPAACLKELINNSYDADAKTVNVFVKPDADRIIIEDDGIGMSRNEFEKHFKRISESHKRDETSLTPSGRPKIGKIGIGFIAANEICDVMEIFSTKEGSRELLHVSIDFALMRLDIEQRRQQGGDIAKADFSGEVTETHAASHYTRIFLQNVRGEAREILASARNRNRSHVAKSLYGLSRDSVVNALSSSDLKSWSEFDSYSQNLLRMALNVPVRYHQDWVPVSCKKGVDKFDKTTKKLGFSLFYDGAEIRKPIILRSGSDRRVLMKTFEVQGKSVSASGYFFARHGSLSPQDLNGVLLRIRHAAVGSYDSTFMEFPSNEGTLFQKWISAEIWADDRLEDAMNIDRKTLRIAHPSYVELQRALHEALSNFIKQVRTEIYESSRITHTSKKAQSTVESLGDLASSSVASVSKEAAKEMVASWRHVASDKKLQKKLVKKYTVADFYRIVLEVAKEILTPSLLVKFVSRLTKRLTE